ncbi:MAG: energy transducer TonB, partial [Cyanobacteria bacterium J06598_3]
GFSKDNLDQYRREIRIMWRVLAVGAVAASGAHILSLPWISRMVSRSEESVEIAATPIEIVVEEELVQEVAEPEPEPPEENPEPAASAERPSAAPLATNTEPLPTSEVASADTVAVAPSIATENGEVDGQGAVGDSAAVGLVTGSGRPVRGGRINLPSITPPARPREPVQEIALAERRQPTSRQVSCNPCTLPEYPATARREGRVGKPVINAIFDANGNVTEAVIEVSSGNADFDRAALEEARRNWRFQDPEGRGGQVSVDVVYVIDDSEQYEEAQQAGEIRAVELPIGQQIRAIAPDSPLSPASASDVESPGSSPDESLEESPESAQESSPNTDTQTVEGQSGEGQSGEAAESNPAEGASTPETSTTEDSPPAEAAEPEQSTGSAGASDAQPSPAPTAPKPAASEAPVSPTPIEPPPVAPPAEVLPAPSLAPPSPPPVSSPPVSPPPEPVVPVVPAAPPAAPPDIVPAPVAE